MNERQVRNLLLIAGVAAGAFFLTRTQRAPAPPVPEPEPEGEGRAQITNISAPSPV